MRILVDMDGIITDLLGRWLDAYNEDWDDNLTVDMIDSWYMWECVKPECGKEILQYLGQPGFFDDLPALPGAIEGVRALKSMGHDIKFATTPSGPDSARAKMRWLDKYFAGSGLSSSDAFICYDKTWIDADMLIDDKPSTLERWMQGSPGLSATIEYPYNAHVATNLMAADCNNTQKAWEQIVQFVSELENVVMFRRRG